MTKKSANPPLLRIAVAGSECTGKTTLARALAEHYRTVWVPEFVRQFVLDKGESPVRADLDLIARGQMALEHEVTPGASGIIILDTDLLSTVIYSRHYYGDCPHWIEETLAARPADLYLLTDIDVPWTPDGPVRDRGHMREEMQRLFVDELKRREYPSVEVRGTLEERLEAATRAIDLIAPAMH